MKKTIVLLTGIVCGSIFLMGNEDGVAFNGKDRTGSPISTGLTCSQCHSNSPGNFNPSITARLLDAGNNVVTSYIPGETYTWEVSMTAANGSPKYGFQSVALLSGNLNAGNFTAISSNSKVTTFSGRKYAEQTAPSTSGLFQLSWTAPAAGSGNVTFYTKGNATNGLGTTSGDNPVSHPNVVISEQSGNDISEFSRYFRIYPNPAQEQLNLLAAEGGILNLEIIDLSGRILITETIQTQAGNPHAISLNDLSVGAYFIKLTNQNSGSIHYTPFIKH